MTTKPSASDVIAERLRSRELDFAPWFDVDDDAVTPYTDRATAIRNKAQELGWEPSVTDEDATDEENAEAELEDARGFLLDKREYENCVDEEILGISATVIVELRIDLSTNGPGDYLTGELSLPEGYVSNVLYHFVTWFDYASLPVADDSPLYRLMERAAQNYEETSGAIEMTVNGGCTVRIGA